MKQSESSNHSETERFFQDVPSRIALLVSCIAVALFGLLFVAGGVDQISKSGGALKGAFFLILGSFIVYLVWRFWKSTTGPRVSLTSDEIVLHKILGNKRWLLSDVLELISFPTIIYPKSPKGRSLPPVNIHYLGIKARSGEFSKFVLPKFSGNVRLLESLEERTGLSIKHIEGDEAFAEWEKGRN